MRYEIWDWISRSKIPLNFINSTFLFPQIGLLGNHRKFPEMFINKVDFYLTTLTLEKSGSRGYLEVEGVALGWDSWVPVPHNAVIDVLLGEGAGGGCCPPIRQVLSFYGAVCRHVNQKDHLPCESHIVTEDFWEKWKSELSSFLPLFLFQQKRNDVPLYSYIRWQ